MDESQRLQELAKYAQGQPSQVNDRGNYGWLGGTMVSRSGNEVVHNGDRVSVVDDRIVVNGRWA